MKIRGILLLFTALFISYSCTEPADIDSEDNKFITDLQGTVYALQDAYNSGKVIQNINFTQEANDLFVITFTDGSTIELKDETAVQNDKTPYLLINQDGFWCLSYDMGYSFTRIMDNNGMYIKAVNEKKEEDISIKFSIDENSFQIFTLYHTNDPDNIIDTLRTKLQANPANIIQSIQQNDLTCHITITLNDSTSFTFKKSHAEASGIVLLTTQGIKLGKEATATIEFRVNPSNATFNYNIGSPDCQIELDLVCKTRTSYTTAPTNYALTKVELVYDENGIIKKGQYRAYITDTGIDDDYIEDAALVLTIDDANNEKVQISSTVFNIKFSGNLLYSFSFLKKDNEQILADIEVPISDNSIELCNPLIISTKHLIATYNTNGEHVFVNDIEQISGVSCNDFTNPVTYKIVSAKGDVNTYNISVSNTGLPIVVIETPENKKIPAKTQDWLGGTKIKIFNSDGTIDYENSNDNIRGRGNTTWTYPKKPYALKLENKAPILNMPEHKRWVLLANWMDRTLLRNCVAFKISQSTGLDWTPRGDFVEVILNGKHIGNYYLCEQIRIDENRVDINNLKNTDIEGDDITGGYLIELDKNYDEVHKFKSAIKNLPYMFKEPDEEMLNTSQFEYLENYINTLETLLYDNNLFATRDYTNYIDINSFIDWWFVHELARNQEPGHPKSCYMHKDYLGKLKAGPIWDFDWGTFIPNSYGFQIKHTIYYDALFSDPDFVDRVKERWNLLKPTFSTIPDFIETEKNKLAKSADINIKMWPISQRVNKDEDLSYEMAIEQMKFAYEQRLQWLDTQINNM